MNINFHKPSTLDRNLKATIQRSGKIGFTAEAANKLKLSVDKSLMIGNNADDKDDQNLYVVVNDPKEEDAFQVLKAGSYYYVNTKPLFKTLRWDYEKYNYSFEITEENSDGNVYYKFKTSRKERDINEEPDE
ncbi:MAG: hypothetical protein JSU01_07425 [Bacteroidetes bacterium]|nr:hypothetical protein [Bacteroidota bacterium]